MRNKIITSLLALFMFFMVGVAITVLYVSSAATDLNRIIKLHQVEELRRSFIISIHSVKNNFHTIHTPFEVKLDTIVKNVTTLNEISHKCLTCHHQQPLSDRLITMQSLVHDYESKLSYFITTRANADRLQRLKMDASIIGDKLLKLSEEMSHSASTNLAESTVAAMSEVNHIKIILFVTLLVTFILGILVSIRLTKSITRPVNELVKATALISSGKFGSVIDYKDKTEFGKLATYFNKMSVAIKDGYEKTKREISDRKQVEKALRESEEKFRTFFEVSPVGIIIYPATSDPLNKPLTFATFNSAFHNFFDYTRNELNNMSISGISYPEDIGKNKALISELLSGKSNSFKMEKRYIKKSGDIFWGYLHVTLLRDISGNASEVMTTLVDITERKIMESEQLKIEKLESVGILAGGIAHDFNNILTSIVINLARAKMSLDSRENLSSMLTDAEDSCRRAKDLTNKLITFSRGGAPVKKIMSISEQLTDSTMFALRGSNVKCKFHLSRDLWHVEIDEGQMNQVIVNLVINATQAMPNGGTIYITAENLYAGTHNILSLPKMNFIKITVRDKGHGIPKEHIQKIFDPYFTTKKKGSGLGLSSAYSIIKNHGGYIDVRSETGSGSVFDIYLPAARIKSTVKNKEKQHLKGEGKVLLMDDDDTLRATISKTLNQLGYEVQLSSEGSEAIEIYEEALASDKPFDAVIMDLTISSGMGGKEAIAKLLKIDPKVKAIMSSGYSDDTIMANYKNYGFCGIITKPYEIEDLNELLSTVIKDED